MSYSNKVLSLNPTRYWRLDETSGTVAVDAVGIGNGTYMGSPTLNVNPIAGMDGGAVTFDGVDDSVSVPALGINTGNWTISAWVRTTNTSTTTWIYHEGVGTGTDHQTALYLQSNGNVSFYKRTTTNSILTSSGQLVNDGNWHHVAATINGTTVKIYIDGTERASGTVSGAVAASNVAYIGRRNYATDPGFLNGSMDEVAIFSGVLTADQVANISHPYDSYDEIVKSWSPLRYYRFNESSGTTVVDESGNGGDGTYLNSPLLEQPSPLADPYDSAVAFDIATPRGGVEFPSPWSDFRNKGFTISMWVKAAYTGNYQFLFDFHDGDTYSSTTQHLLAYISTNGSLIFRGRNSSAVQTVSAAGNYSDGNWHHLVFIRSSGTNDSFIYVDGVQKGVGTINTLPSTITKATIGHTVDGTYRVEGAIDEFFIEQPNPLDSYFYVRTPGEIQKLYNARLLEPGEPETPVNIAAATATASVNATVPTITPGKDYLYGPDTADTIDGWTVVYGGSATSTNGEIVLGSTSSPHGNISRTLGTQLSHSIEFDMFIPQSSTDIYFKFNADMSKVSPAIRFAALTGAERSIQYVQSGSVNSYTGTPQTLGTTTLLESEKTRVRVHWDYVAETVSVYLGQNGTTPIGTASVPRSHMTGSQFGWFGYNPSNVEQVHLDNISAYTHPIGVNIAPSVMTASASAHESLINERLVSITTVASASSDSLVPKILPGWTSGSGYVTLPYIVDSNVMLGEYALSVSFDIDWNKYAQTIHTFLFGSETSTSTSIRMRHNGGQLDTTYYLTTTPNINSTESTTISSITLPNVDADGYHRFVVSHSGEVSIFRSPSATVPVATFVLPYAPGDLVGIVRANEQITSLPAVSNVKIDRLVPKAIYVDTATASATLPAPSFIRDPRVNVLSPVVGSASAASLIPEREEVYKAVDTPAAAQNRALTPAVNPLSLYEQEVLADNPEAWLRFRETSGTTVYDHNGVARGELVGDTQRIVSTPLRYTSGGGSIRTTSTSYIDLQPYLGSYTGVVTVEFWWRAATGDQLTSAGGTNIYPPVARRISTEGTTTDIDRRVAPGGRYSSWHHATMSFSGTSSLIRLGEFDGYISEVAVYKTGLSSERKNAHFLANQNEYFKTVLNDGAQVYMPFSDGSHRNYGPVQVFSWVENPAASGGIMGEYEGSSQDAGARYYPVGAIYNDIHTPDGARRGGAGNVYPVITPETVEVWFKPESSDILTLKYSTANTIVDGGGAKEFGISISGGNTLTVTSYSPSNSVSTQVTPLNANYEVGDWNHLVLKENEGLIEVILNTVVVGNATNYGHGLKMGSFNIGNIVIDEFAMYTTPLSTQQIANHYAFKSPSVTIVAEPFSATVVARTPNVTAMPLNVERATVEASAPTPAVLYSNYGPIISAPLSAASLGALEPSTYIERSRTVTATVIFDIYAFANEPGLYLELGRIVSGESATASALMRPIIVRTGYDTLVFANNPKVYYRLEEHSGNLYDEVVAQLSTVTIGTNGAINYGAIGIPGNGADTAVAFRNAYARANLGTGIRTIEFWVKPQGFTENSTNLPDFFSSDDLKISHTKDYHQLRLSFGGASNASYFSESDLLPDVWHYIVVKKNADTAQTELYVNNTLAGTVDGTSWTVGNALFGYEGPADTSGVHGTMLMDEFAAYTTELTANEMSERYYTGGFGVDREVSAVSASAQFAALAPELVLNDSINFALPMNASTTLPAPEVRVSRVVDAVSSGATITARIPVVGQGDVVYPDPMSAHAYSNGLNIFATSFLSIPVARATARGLQVNLTHSPNASVLPEIMEASAGMLAPPYMDRYTMEVMRDKPRIYFRFNEDDGIVVRDSMGYAPDGVLLNGTVLDVPGAHGTGILFDGTNDYVMIPDTDNRIENMLKGDNTNGFTLEFWFKTSHQFFYSGNARDEKALLWKGTPGSAGGHRIATLEGHGAKVKNPEMFWNPNYPSNDGRAQYVNWWLDGAGSQEDFYNGGGFDQYSDEYWWNDNKWHHVVITRGFDLGTVVPERAGYAILYVDGHAFDVTTFGRNQGQATAPVSLAPGQPLLIARKVESGNNLVGEPWFFEGQIDDLIIYDKPLSQTRLRAHYKAGHPSLNYPDTRIPDSNFTVPVMSASATAIPANAGGYRYAPQILAQKSKYHSSVISDNPLAWFKFDDDVATTGSYFWATSPTATYPTTVGQNSAPAFLGEDWLLKRTHPHYVRGAVPSTGTPLIENVGGSASLDGVDDFIVWSGYSDVNSLPSNNIKTTFTVEAWVRPTERRDQAIVSTDLTAFMLRLTADGHIAFGNGRNDAFRYNLNYQPGEWYHIVVVITGAANPKLYVNGSLVAHTTHTAFYPFLIGNDYPNNNILLGSGRELFVGFAGRYHLSDGRPGQYFKGNIDEVAIYRHALTATDVEEHYRYAREKMVEVFAPAANANAVFIEPNVIPSDNTSFVLAPALATARGLAPQITGGADVRVIGVPSSEATADSYAPEFQLGQNINAVRGTASAGMNAPGVTGIKSPTINPLPAFAEASALAPIEVGSVVKVSVPRMSAVAFANTPSVLQSNVLVLPARANARALTPTITVEQDWQRGITLDLYLGDTELDTYLSGTTIDLMI